MCKKKPAEYVTHKSPDKNWHAAPILPDLFYEMHTVELFQTKRLCLTKDVKQKFISNYIDITDLEIGIQLGVGGFGSVCECYINKKRYALKKFHRLSKNKRAARESYECEKQALNLCHPNIVRSYFTFTFDGSECVLMEYVDRKTLQATIDNQKEVLDKKRRTRLLIQIASGLEYAHLHDIAHLDLKPSNILMTVTGDCKIADFGCCQKISAKTSPSTPTKSNLTGTYAYRAPELFKGESPTTKADIYSLGICLWQMLVRERPYGSEHHQVVIFKVVAYDLRPRLPEKFSAEEKRDIELMQICWHKEKSRRPSARGVIECMS